MSIPATVNKTFIGQFPVLELNGVDKVTGESDFVKRVWFNAQVSTEEISISEIGNSGEYKVEFIPKAVGFWKLEVTVNYNGKIYVWRLDATDAVSSSATASVVLSSATTRRERYIIRINRLNTKVAIWEDTLESIVTGKNEEYMFSEPDGAQRARKIDPMSIQKMLNGYYAEIERLHARLRGAGLTAVRTER